MSKNQMTRISSAHLVMFAVYASASVLQVYICTYIYIYIYIYIYKYVIQGPEPTVPSLGGWQRVPPPFSFLSLLLSALGLEDPRFPLSGGEDPRFPPVLGGRDHTMPLPPSGEGDRGPWTLSGFGRRGPLPSITTGETGARAPDHVYI